VQRESRISTSLSYPAPELADTLAGLFGGAIYDKLGTLAKHLKDYGPWENIEDETELEEIAIDFE